MGFSVSAATAILFSSFLYLFMIIFGTVNTTYDTVSEADREEFDRMIERKQTEIELIDTNYSQNVVTITAHNAGSSTLDTSEIDVILDGVWASSNITSLLVNGESSDMWAPLEDLEIQISADNEPSRIKIITGSGNVIYGGM
jgi:archaeal flagellar protein FlaF